jgi:hypothetical protein
VACTAARPLPSPRQVTNTLELLQALLVGCRKSRQPARARFGLCTEARHVVKLPRPAGATMTSMQPTRSPGVLLVQLANGAQEVWSIDQAQPGLQVVPVYTRLGQLPMDLHRAELSTEGVSSAAWLTAGNREMAPKGYPSTAAALYNAQPGQPACPRVQSPAMDARSCTSASLYVKNLPNGKCQSAWLCHAVHDHTKVTLHM